jgi:hypothetical protein
MVHRARALVVTHRTALVNQTRRLLGEFGLIVPKGVAQLRRELPDILVDTENGLRVVASEVLSALLERLRDLDEHIRAYTGTTTFPPIGHETPVPFNPQYPLGFLARYRDLLFPEL